MTTVPEAPDWRPVPDPTLLTTQQLLRELAALRELLETRINALDRLLSRRMDDADRAINAALASAEKAVSKAETSAERRFEAVNEFRKTLPTRLPRSSPAANTTRLMTR